MLARVRNQDDSAEESRHNENRRPGLYDWKRRRSECHA